MAVGKETKSRCSRGYSDLCVRITPTVSADMIYTDIPSSDSLIVAEQQRHVEALFQISQIPDPDEKAEAEAAEAERRRQQELEFGKIR